MHCNIDSKGRTIRAINAFILMLVALFVWWIQWPVWISAILGACGLFSGFEAAKGWCALRAMGIKTKY